METHERRNSGDRRRHHIDRRIVSERRITERREDSGDATPGPKYLKQLFDLPWPTSDEELIRRQRVAAWGLNTKFQNAEDKICVLSECAICHETVRRLWILVDGALLISPWMHDYGAAHPVGLALPGSEEE